MGGGGGGGGVVVLREHKVTGALYVKKHHLQK